MRTEKGFAEGCEIHYGMDFDTYCRLPGINASALKGDGRHSAKHLDAVLNHLLPSGDSDDKKFGRAAHCLVLESERFEAAFPLATICCATTKPKKKGETGKACSNQGILRTLDGRWWCGVHKEQKDDEDKVVEVAQPVADFVTGESLPRLYKLRDALKASNANEYLARPGYSEAVIVWQQLGFTLKTRIDRLSVTPELITLIDIKKCQVGCANYEEAQRACEKFLYHLQAWMHYAAVLAAFGSDVPIESYFLFCEDDIPHDTYLLRVNDDDIRIADRNIVNQLNRYNRCKKAGAFDGCQPFINPDKSGLLPANTVKYALKGE